jgi:pimeloyl-ACP methyl ester carboxylesterase
MPRLSVTPAAEINCQVDGFTDPWAEPETVLMVHGLAESSAVWWAWMPHLVRRLQVARIDQRGFGMSTPMPEDFAWSTDVLADDIGQVIRQVAPKGVHLVGAKIAGPVVIRAARRHPELVKTLSLIGVPVQGPKEAEWLALVEKQGVRAWAAATMDARLAGMSRAMKDWWIDLMAATPRSTMLGFLRFVSSIDVRDDLPRLHCPVLVVSSDSPRRPIATVVEWQRKIPDASLVTVAGDGYHAAATEPDACAQAVAAFIGDEGRRRSG